VQLAAGSAGESSESTQPGPGIQAGDRVRALLVQASAQSFWSRSQPSDQSCSGTSPAASANARNAPSTTGRCAFGNRRMIRAISARRPRVTSAISVAPATVSDTRTVRRSPLLRRRATRPLRTKRSHILVAVDGSTASASARSASRCDPREANTTNARYCASVTSSATVASERAATPTSARLAPRTASTSSSPPRPPASPVRSAKDDSCTTRTLYYAQIVGTEPQAHRSAHAFAVLNASWRGFRCILDCRRMRSLAR
jgi:hypothetical protein